MTKFILLEVFVQALLDFILVFIAVIYSPVSLILRAHPERRPGAGRLNSAWSELLMKLFSPASLITEKILMLGAHGIGDKHYLSRFIET